MVEGNGAEREGKGGSVRKLEGLCAQKRGVKAGKGKEKDIGDLEVGKIQARRKTWASFSTGSSIVELICN